jgi:hypothetical protein
MFDGTVCFWEREDLRILSLGNVAQANPVTGNIADGAKNNGMEAPGRPLPGKLVRQGDTVSRVGELASGTARLPASHRL